MDCNKCGGKMEKFKYMKYSEIEGFLNNEYVSPPKCTYIKWLKLLNEMDLVKTEFIRKSFGKTTTKYYLRIIENKKRTGIKLRHLSKTFKYETGTITYGENTNKGIFTSYKILPIYEIEDRIIRKYCNESEEFDIDTLNNLITLENRK